MCTTPASVTGHATIKKEMGDSTMQASYLQSRGDMLSQKRQSAEMQHCGTTDRALYSQLHLYIGEDLEQSRKGNEIRHLYPDF